MLARAGVHHVSAEEAFGLCGLREAGLWIPYRDPTGVPVPDGGAEFSGVRNFGRLRLDTPVNDRKYHSWAGSHPHVFKPPGDLRQALYANDGDLHLIEGEFKALSLADAGYAAVGLGGFYCHARPHEKPGASPELLPELMTLIRELSPRRILFVGDNDTCINWQFSDAAAKLAKDAAVQVALPRIPWDAPGKGADDCREALGDAEFGAWWRNLVDAAIAVRAGVCWQEIALAVLSPEIEGIRAHPRDMSKTSERLTTMLTHAESVPLAAENLRRLVAPLFGGMTVLRRTVKEHQQRSRATLDAPKDFPLAPSDADIAKTHGKPIRWEDPKGKDGDQRGHLNQVFFAVKIVKDRGWVFDATGRTFYEYDAGTGLWRAVRTPDVIGAITDTVGAMIRDEDVLSREHNCPTMRNIASLAESKALEEGFFDAAAEQPHIHALNGMFCLRDLALKPFGADWRSRHQLTVEYRPGATCPRFLALLAGNLDADDIGLFQRWAGLALAGGNPAQKIMMLQGTGGTGKGTVANVMQCLIGEPNCGELRTSQLAERFELSRYHKYRFLYGPDAQADFLSHKSASLLKAMVGDDLLEAEEKGKNGGVKRRGCWDILITSNSRLLVRLEGDHSAWKRRLVILDFHGSPTANPIERYGQRLAREEGSGILNWLIEGYKLADRQLTMTPAQTARVASVIMQSASLPSFVDQFIVADADADTTVSEIVEAYAAHCRMMQWIPVPSAERQLPDMLLQRFGVTRANSVTRNGKAARGWRGVRVFHAGARATSSDPSQPSQDTECLDVGTPGTGSTDSLSHTRETHKSGEGQPAGDVATGVGCSHSRYQEEVL